MNANDLFVADAIERTNSAELEAAAAQLHTLTGWLADTGTVIVDRARLNEARLTIVGG